MKKIIVNNGFIFLAFLFLYACSGIKNPLATTNFKRVKYNSHVRLSKSNSESQKIAKAQKKLPETVKSFDKENLTKEIPVNYTSNGGELEEKSAFKQVVRNEALEKTAKRIELLKNISAIQINETLPNSKVSLLQKQDNWWEDDIEDWPWLEIALAIIAVLIIAILVSLFVNIVGGFISSLLGLILLIALAYILYTLWF